MRERGDPVPQHLIDAIEEPELPIRLQWVWDCFQDLHPGRITQGLGVRFISWSEVREWCNAYQIDDHSFHYGWELIQRADAAHQRMIKPPDELPADGDVHPEDYGSNV